MKPTAIAMIRRTATDLEHFGKNLTAAMAEAEINPSELARLMGTSRQNIKWWESGPIPSLENLLRLAAALEQAHRLLPDRRRLAEKMAPPPAEKENGRPGKRRAQASR